MPELDYIKSLQQALEQALAPRKWNKARIDFLSRFLIALLVARTTCLSQVATLFPGQAQIASHYQRIRRFVGSFVFDLTDLARIVLHLARQTGATAPYILSFDRTEWGLGRATVNLFVIGLVWHQVVFPLIWMSLDKAGSSNTEERKVLLEKVVALLGVEQIAFVIGDREFCCEGLLAWLKEKKISYRLRLKGDVLLSNGRGEKVRAEWLFHRQGLGQELNLKGARSCLNHEVFVSGMRLVNDKGKVDSLIVVSNVPAPLSDYALRWPIENLFSGLKSRGFDLEATHLLVGDRLERLFGLLAVAFAWSVAMGRSLTAAQVAKGKVPRRKKHGRLAVSEFRAGLDRLQRVFAPLCGNQDVATLHDAFLILYGT
jgi:hypothetical protein